MLKYQNNLNTSSLFTQNTPFIDSKIDRFFQNKDHVSGRFSFEKPTLNQAGLFGVFGGPISGGGIGGAEGYGNEKIYSTGVNWVHTFAFALLSEARFGVSRFDNLAFPTGYGQPLAEQVGIPGANISQFTSSITAINGEGFSDPMIGGCSNCPWNRAGTIIEGVENMTKVRGNHTLEWGATITVFVTICSWSAIPQGSLPLPPARLLQRWKIRRPGKPICQLPVGCSEQYQPRVRKSLSGLQAESDICVFWR